MSFALLAGSMTACTTATESATTAPGGPRDLTVETRFGLVEGYADDGVFSYRGIPYAAPPTGALRWKPPADPEPWSDTLSAVEVPSPCPQEVFGGLPVPGFMPSEDCLYLNVDTPSVGSGLPVMVWIHGGAFTLGEGVQTDGGTAGDRIARQAGTIVVSMNYRLGQLGFLAHSALSAESDDQASGNFGLMDQTAALEWVRGNIDAFGGDPDNVTIFGESAGAFSVCSHLASPASAGLFHKAILQSGSCERPFSTLSAAEAQGDVFAESLGCAAADDTLACMRAKTPEEVLDALPQGDNFGFNPTSEPTGSWGPIVDGAFIPTQPSEAFATGDFNRVPTIVGFTREEARLFVWIGELADPPLEVTEQSYESLIAYFLGGNTDLAARAVAEYPLPEYSEPAVAFAAVATDLIFRCPAKREAAKLASFVPTYLFQFEYPDGHSQLEVALPFIDGGLPSYPLAAFHGADIPYVFGYDPLLEIDFTNFSTVLNTWQEGTTDEALWLQTLGYFTRFAATGDPNGDRAVEWPVYEEALDEHLVLDATVTVDSGAAPKCAFWEGEDYLVSELD